MRMRLGLALAVVLAVAGASVAFATTVPDVLYDPPRLVFTDRFAHATGEDLVVTVDGPDYVLSNPSGMVRHPDSEEGCDENFSTEFHCPRAGVERIILNLNGADDRAEFALGEIGKRVTQRALGGVGEDRLRGHRGPQLLFGEDDNDRLRGGRGPDTLDGGSGTDDCDGGPGADVLIDCE